MHSTRRWVHTGLVLTVVVMSMSLTVLVLGATRGTEINYGLPGAVAPNFYLKDANNNPITLADNSKHATVLIFGGHGEQINNCTTLINNLLKLYNKEEDVQIFGIASSSTLSILGPGEIRRSVLQEQCPNLKLAIDTEGTVARDYRVNGSPVLFIVDKDHIIRGRIMLASEGVDISIPELIQSVRPSMTSLNQLNVNPIGLHPELP